MHNYLSDVVDFIYPPRCLNCENRLFGSERNLCLTCHFDLPRTDFEKHPQNSVLRRFTGRFHLQNAAAWLHFEKGSVVQKLMHEFKYRDRPDLAEWLGYQMGLEWKEAPILQDVDLIVPVPLHWRKLWKRGYNQAACIGAGLSKAIEKPHFNKLLKRRVYGSSQTNEHRFNRWQKVQSVFTVTNEEPYRGKHILLIDDVLTTGATAEACLWALASIPEARFSLLCLAHA
jgi:ComF family protein